MLTARVLKVRRRGGAARALLAAFTAGAACTFSRDVRVLPHQLADPGPEAVTAINAAEQLERGFVPEVLAFLAGPGARSLAPDTALLLLGRAPRWAPGRRHSRSGSTRRTSLAFRFR